MVHWELAVQKTVICTTPKHELQHNLKSTDTKMAEWEMILNAPEL